MSKERRAVDHVQRLCARSIDSLEGWTAISSGVGTLTTLSSSASEGAAALRFSTAFAWYGVGGFHRTTTRVRLGIASLRSCSRLALSSASIIDSPVTFPPGWDRFATKPNPTGSATMAITMGMVDVARRAAWVAGVVSATITSTFLSTRSAANCGSRA
jgi:hypothetical protein